MLQINDEKNVLNASNVLTKKLFASSRAYRKKLEENYWVFFVPDKIGMPVIVDASLNEIFDKFSNGFTIQDFISYYYSNPNNLKDDPSILIDKVFFLIKKGVIRTTPDKLSYPTNNFLDLNQIKSLTFWIHITNDCNLCCKYCYVHKTKAVMNSSTIKQVVKKIVYTVKLYNLENISLSFAGGEPTLALDKIKLFKHLILSDLEGVEVNIRIHIVSNGTLVDEKLIAFLKETKATIGISLDGYGELSHDIYRKFKNDQTGSWKIISANINKLLGAGISPHIMGTISNDSSSSLTSLATWIIENKLSTRLGIIRGDLESSKYRNLTVAQRHQKYIDTYINSFEQMFCELEKDKYIMDVGRQLTVCDLRFNVPTSTTCCSIGVNHIVINEVGKLANCQMRVNQAQVIEGNDLLINIRKMVNFSPKQRKEGEHPCLLCRWFPVCGGGCPIYNDEIYKDYLHTSIFHEFYQYVIPRYIDFFGRKLIQSKNRKNKSTAKPQHNDADWNISDFSG